VPCGRGFHKECLKGCKKCHEDENEILILNPGSRKKGNKADGLKDPLSTGRKRAAELYPLDKEAPCEWRNRKGCGGGKRPIVGCVDGKQVARHHGPVKDTTRNHEGNVHRICTRCHNHWHELNDLVYDEREYALLPHDPIAAEPDELIADEMAWRMGDMGRKYELASSKNRKGKLILED
jgi:hypothetical protein